MKPFECACEDEVLAAVGSGRWPSRVDAELRAHVSQCAVCRDVVTVAEAFGREDAEPGRLAESAAAHIPDSGAMWFRAQLRARQEAARTAVRPITVAQALSFASVIGLLGVLLGASSSWLQTGVQWLAGRAASLDPRGVPMPTGILATLSEHATVVGLIGAALLVTPIAVYWAMREPRN
jgi:hypothetical protein